MQLWMVQKVHKEIVKLIHMIFSEENRLFYLMNRFIFTYKHCLANINRSYNYNNTVNGWKDV